MKTLMNFVLVAVLAIPMLAVTGCSSKEHAEPKDKMHDHYGS